MQTRSAGAPNTISIFTAAVPEKTAKPDIQTAFAELQKALAGRSDDRDAVFAYMHCFVEGTFDAPLFLPEGVAAAHMGKLQEYLDGRSIALGQRLSGDPEKDDAVTYELLVGGEKDDAITFRREGGDWLLDFGA